YHLRQDRQGFVRDLLARRWRSAGDRGGARYDASDGPCRDRAGHRRDHRQKSRQGAGSKSEARPDRLVRRSGDEGVRRQGEPEGGERAAQNEARSLKSDVEHTAGPRETNAKTILLFVRPRSSPLLANHFADRFARFVPDRAVGSTLVDLLTEDFLHKLFSMINAGLRGRL